MKLILGRKLKMAQLFDDEGRVIPVTLVKAGPCFVTQVKNKEKDGYYALQLGFEPITKEKKIKKPMQSKPYKILKEIRFKEDEAPLVNLGDEINLLWFQEGEKVKVSAVSKGKGYAGAVKRWGFKDRAKAHGSKDMRQIGSVGSRFPQRVIKGKKMPGHMGGGQITVKNLEIVKIDPKNHIAALKGAIPGKRGSLVEIKAQGILKQPQESKPEAAEKKEVSA